MILCELLNKILETVTNYQHFKRALSLAVDANGPKLGDFVRWNKKNNAKLFYLHFNVLLTSLSHDNLRKKTKNRSFCSIETLIKFKFRMRFFRTRHTKQLFRQLIVLINSNQFISVNEFPRKKSSEKRPLALFFVKPKS